MKVLGMIPARYASTRLPGKPLIDLGGKPMIQHVFERVSRASLLSEVIVATDDSRIFDAVRSFGGRSVMTPRELASGTDRIAHAAENMDADIIVNIQGDEPLIEPEEVDCAARILMEDSNAVMGTLVKKINRLEDLESSNTAKVILDENGYALFFSRAPIPFVRDVPRRTDWLQQKAHYKHIGIYSYRKSFLIQFASWPVSRLEKLEQLEQLRAIERGFRIKTAETNLEPVCVDTLEDAERVRRLLTRHSGMTGK